MKALIFLLALLIIPVVSAIEECKGTIDLEESPCQVFLPYTDDCSALNVGFYFNGSQFVEIQTMGTYTSFLCNATFTASEGIGTYSFNYSTGDTGSIIVEEGNMEILLFYFALAIIGGLLLLGFWKEDHILLSLSGIIMMVVGLYLIINGWSIFDNLISQAIAMVFVGMGLYIIFRANYEHWQSS